MVRINWITLSAKYSGRCLIDGGPIRVGEKVEWCKGIGVRHISCGKKADQVEELKEKSFEAVARGDFDLASKFANEALDIEPNGKEIFNLAQSVYDKWDFEGAIKLYDRFLKKNPNNISGLHNMAAALRAAGETKEAIRYYNKIIKIQPENTDALIAIIDAYIETENCKKAIPVLKKVEAFIPFNIGTAVRFAACGDYHHAIKIADKILSKNPDDFDTRFRKLYWLIDLMGEQRLEKDALKIVNRYLKNEPKFFVYQLKANFYRRSNRMESAKEVYRTALNEEPETDFDRLVKSNALLVYGNHVATRKFCEENMHRDAIAPSLLHTIGLAYQRQHKLIEALEIFERLRQKNEEAGITDTDLLRNIANINEKLGDDNAALSIRVKVLEYDKNDKEMLVKVIQIFKKRFKDSTMIFAYLKRLHGLYPNNNNFTMEYANALMKKKEYKQAAALYEPIVEQYDLSDETYDDSKIAYLKLGECLLKMGDAKTAYNIFRELVKDDKKFKEAWTGLAKAATELGKIIEAEKAIKKAANLEKYEISRDTTKSRHIEGAPFTPTMPSQQPPERSLSKGPNVVQKPTFKYSPKTKMADKGVEKTFVDNINSLLNVDGGAIQIGFTDGKPTGLFNDLKLFPKKQRNHEEFEKKLRETLQNRLTDSNIWRDIRITFPKTHSVVVCEMFIPKSSIPVWVVTKNKDEEFYVRLKKELVRLTPKEQKEYIDEHFFDVE